MAANGLRAQYPAGAPDALSPRPLYDYPSPTSNYNASAYLGGSSPGLEPDMAVQSAPRYGSKAFVPPPDLFLDDDAPNPLREPAKRCSEVLSGDPVAVHLLVETAIGDSRNFDILSFDEVEALKREQHALRPRIASVKQKLTLESKVRDATKSLKRLTKDRGHRRNFSSRGSNVLRDSAVFAKQDDELAASVAKCDELTRELHHLEERARTVQTQLLQHTAGILQLTHEEPRRQQPRSVDNGVGRRPDSPASLYLYESRLHADANGDDAFDERSLYRSPENLDSLMDALRNGTHHQVEATEKASAAMVSVERRLQHLHDRLREILMIADPERNPQDTYAPSSDNTDTPSSVEQHLEFLDQGLQDLRAEQEYLSSARQAQQRLAQSQQETEGRLVGINHQVYALLSRSPDTEHYAAPPASGEVDEQLRYMEDAFHNVEQLHHRMAQSMGLISSAEYENVLSGLWSILQASEMEARQRKQQSQSTSEADDSDSFPDEDATNEFSLSAFSAKVQQLCARFSSLQEKDDMLRRQIEQQRELNARSDAQREAESSRLRSEAEQSRSDKEHTQQELDQAVRQLEQLDEERAARDSAEGQALRDARGRCQALERHVVELQDDAQIQAAEMRAQLSESAAKLEGLGESLRAATSEKDAADSRAAEANAARDATEAERSALEGEVVRLTTEVTLAKAELDGAYGSRAERAAEAGPMKQELDHLRARNSSLVQEADLLRQAADTASRDASAAADSVRGLKQELAAMAHEYEGLTKDAIQHEKDRDGLEAVVDALRDEKEQLELDLSDERVRWLGMRSPATAGAMPGSATGTGPQGAEQTSIRMLREDFRKMMRDRTAEGLKALRVSLHCHDRALSPLLTPPLSERARGAAQARGPRPLAAQRGRAQAGAHQVDRSLRGCLCSSCLLCQCCAWLSKAAKPAIQVFVFRGRQWV